MPRRDDRLSMQQMLEYAQEILSLTGSRTRSDLDKDRLLSLAVTRLLEILGEAASRVTPTTRELHPAIPWANIVALRNRLIHGYDEVDQDIVWSIVEGDLPELAAQLEAALRG
jgi:uncharacterized protein with HEPN domain